MYDIEHFSNGSILVAFPGRDIEIMRSGARVVAHDMPHTTVILGHGTTGRVASPDAHYDAFDLDRVVPHDNRYYVFMSCSTGADEFGVAMSFGALRGLVTVEAPTDIEWIWENGKRAVGKEKADHWWQNPRKSYGKEGTVRVYQEGHVFVVTGRE